MAENDWALPNTCVSSNTLHIDGERSNLRHIEELIELVDSGRERICGALRSIFVEKVPDPTMGRSASTSLVVASESFNDCARKFVGSGAREDGIAVLQWCAVLSLLVLATKDYVPGPDIRDGVRIAAFMAENGAPALVVTRQQWMVWERRVRATTAAGPDSVGGAEVSVPPAEKVVVRVPFIVLYMGDGVDGAAAILRLIKKRVVTHLTYEDGIPMLASSAGMVRVYSDFGLSAIIHSGDYAEASFAANLKIGATEVAALVERIPTPSNPTGYTARFKRDVAPVFALLM